MALEGTFLLEVPPGCEFRTNNEAFSNCKRIIQSKPPTLLKIIRAGEKNQTIHVKRQKVNIFTSG